MNYFLFFFLFMRGSELKLADRILGHVQFSPVRLYDAVAEILALKLYSVISIIKSGIFLK